MKYVIDYNKCYELANSLDTLDYSKSVNRLIFEIKVVKERSESNGLTDEQIEVFKEYFHNRFSWEMGVCLNNQYDIYGRYETLDDLFKEYIDDEDFDKKVGRKHCPSRYERLYECLIKYDDDDDVNTGYYQTYNTENEALDEVIYSVGDYFNERNDVFINSEWLDYITENNRRWFDGVTIDDQSSDLYYDIKTSLELLFPGEEFWL